MKKIKFIFFALIVIAINSCSKSDDGNLVKLNAPQLLLPENTSVRYFDTSFDFEWSSVENASEYQIQTSYDAAFSQTLFSATSSSNSYNGNSLITEPSDSSIIYWRVRAVGDGFESSDFSQIYSFTLLLSNNTFCDVCGTYEGTANGPIRMDFTSDIGVNTTFVNEPSTLVVAEGSSSTTLELTLNLPTAIGGTPINIPVSVTVNYNATAKSFTASNVNVNVSLIPGIDVPVKITSITGAFVGANVTANVQIDDQDGATDDNIDGDIDFAGTKN